MVEIAHADMIGAVIQSVQLATDNDASDQYCAYRLEIHTDRGLILFKGCHDVCPDLEWMQKNESLRE